MVIVCPSAARTSVRYFASRDKSAAERGARQIRAQIPLVPAKAGTQGPQGKKEELDARLRGHERSAVLLRARAHRVLDQRLAERPDRARLVAVGDDVVECPHDPVAVLVGDNQRRDELDGVAAMT